MTAPISPPSILNQITPAVADNTRVAVRNNVATGIKSLGNIADTPPPSKSKGNFLFSEFYPEVNQELNRRKSSDNLARTYMPFSRLTTAILLPAKGRFFTMGLQGFDNLNPDIESIYEPVGGGNLIGYTFSGGKRIPLYTEEIPSLVGQLADTNYTPRAQQGKEYLENEYLVQRNVKKFPPPGITKVDIRRAGLAGALLQADVEITAYTLGQLQALQEYMLVPGLHAVLEWGQIASGDDEQMLAGNMLDFSNVDDETFLKKLANNEKNRRHIWKEYTKNTKCNYDYLVGKISNFSFTLDGSDYKIKVRISSSGDLIASLANTETSLLPQVNGKDPGVYSTAIREYFAFYFENKLSQDLDGGGDLANHIYLVQTPPKTDKPSQNNEDGTVTESPAGEMFGENVRPYFITWTYFINEIIHGMVGSNNLKYWFEDEGRIPTWYSYPQLEKLGNTSDTEEVVPDPMSWVRSPPIDSLEPKIGCHPFLRSIDPGAMIIYNKQRQDVIDTLVKNNDTSDPTTMMYAGVNDCITNQDFRGNSANADKAYQKFSTYGNFDVTSEYGLLSRGVWINHLIIQEAFLSQDTFHGAIAQILRRMSAASGDYWNLQVHLNESSSKINIAVPNAEFGNDARQQATSNVTAGSNFQIIDARFVDTQKSADELLLKADNIYMFNKRLNSADISSVDYKLKEGASGGELLSLSAEFSLPSILASAIAIQGIKGEGELTKEGRIAYSTPVQYNAMFDSELVDIIRPFKNVNVVSGEEEQHVYPVGGTSAGRQMNLVLGGKGNEAEKMNTAVFAVKTKGPNPYEIEREMGTNLRVVENTVNRLQAANPTSMLSNRWYEAKTLISNPKKTADERLTRMAEFLNTELSGLSDKPTTIGDQLANDIVLDEYNSRQELKNIRQDMDVIFGTGNVSTETQTLILQLYWSAQNISDRAESRKQLNNLNIAVDNVRKSVTASGEDDQPKTLSSLEFSNKLQSNLRAGASTRYYDPIFNTARPALAQQDADRKAKQQQFKEVVERLKHYGTVLYYIEPVPSYMSRRAYQHGLKIKNGQLGQDGSNLFAPAPTRLRAKLTLPGIAGVHIGDLFWIDRIQPNFYLDGVFTTIGLAESITPENGWITSIEAVFLFLGRFHFASYFLGKQPKPSTITGTIT